MRVLIVHNRYQLRGGEDVVADAEAALLRANGVEVRVYQRSNDELRQMPAALAALATIWSRRAAREIAALCQQQRPDLIHFHNTFPLISAAPYWTAAARGIPVVQTLHNFRLLCPQAMLLRDGRPCHDCVGRLPWRAVAHRCYRNSLLQSGVAAGALTAHRLLGSYQHRVQAYIALSQFSRLQYMAGGLPAQRIHVKPNFVPDPGAPCAPARAGGLFVGRLSAEKGVATLIAASARMAQRSSPLQVVGDGPLAAAVAQAAHLHYLGARSPAQVHGLMHSSSFLVAPSTCLETFGLVAVEAFAAGLPVIASGHGGLGELIQDGITGLHVRPGDDAALAQAIDWAQQHPQAMLAMGRAARARYLTHYTPERNFDQLHAIYHHVLSQPGARHAA